MIRKLVLATAAVAAIGTASLTATTPASAWGWGWGGYHHRHFYRGYGFYRVGYDSCWRSVWRVNRFGETVLRRVYVCD